MRSQSAVFVDAGYLIAATATRLTGSSLRRGVKVDYGTLISELIASVELRSGLPLLRVYWYDAGRNGVADQEQEQVAALPKVKLRLGRVGVEGEQKGVDLRIGLDMVGHSRNGAVDIIYLLSGDDDLTEAVEETQAQGVQVVVLAVPTISGQPHGVSRHLVQAADGVEVLDDSLLDKSFSVTKRTALAPATGIAAVARASRIPGPPVGSVPRVPAAGLAPAIAYSGGGDAKPYIAPEYRRDPAELSATIADIVGKAYKAWSGTANSAQLRELREGRPTIPRDLDRALLVDLSDALSDFYLDDQIRSELRSRFWDAVDAPALG